MPEVPDNAVQAAAEALQAIIDPAGIREMDVYRAHARTVLEAAAPALADHSSRAILAHMERQAAQMPETLARRWRRHFGIAARVAAGAFTTEAELKQKAAEHLNAMFAVAKLREETAALILAQKEPCAEHTAPFPKPSCLACARNGAFHRAAMIAAGLRDDLEAKAAPEGGGDR